MSSTRLQQVLVLVALIVFLELVAAVHIVRPAVLPPPHQIAQAAWDAIWSGVLEQHFGATLRRVASAYVFGIAFGVALGFTLWKMPSVIVKSLEPLLASLYAVPWIALYPALLVVFGLGDYPIILVSAIYATIPIALNTFIGLAGIKRAWLNVARVTGCSARQRFFKVLLPGAAPHIAGGLKIGFIYAYLGTIGTEFLRSAEGLGYLVSTSYYYFRNLEMYAYVLVVIALTVVVTRALTVAEVRIGRRFA